METPRTAIFLKKPKENFFFQMLKKLPNYAHC